MAIVFEQAQPLSPSTSMAFGRAQQYSRDLPTIAAMSEAAARNRLQAGIAGLASFDRAMDRTFASDHASKRLQFEADEAVLRAQTALNLGAMRGHQDAALQEQRAQLQVWANSQDITQKEILRQQHLASGLAEVDAAESAGVLTREEANAARLSIRTPLEALKAKGMATQQRHMEAETAQIAEATKRQAVIAQQFQDFEAKTMQGRLGTVVNPTVAKQVEMELVAAGLGDLPNFDEIVKQEALKRPGGADYWIQTAPGKWEQAFQNGTTTADKNAENDMKHYENDHKIWLNHQSAYDRAWRTERDRIQRENEQASRESTGSIRRATDEELDAAADRQVKIPKPGPEPMPPGRRGQQQQSRQDVAAPSQAPAPAGGGPVAQRIKETPRDVLGEQMMMLGQRQDIPEPIKQQAAFMLQQAAMMVDRPGGYNALSQAEKRQFDQLQQAYRSLGIAAKAPTPTGQDVVRQQIEQAQNSLRRK